MVVSTSYIWGLVFLRLVVSNSYVWGLVFLRFGVSNSYVWWLIILTFVGYYLLRLRVSFFTFGG